MEKKVEGVHLFLVPKERTCSELHTYAKKSRNFLFSLVLQVKHKSVREFRTNPVAIVLVAFQTQPSGSPFSRQQMVPLLNARMRGEKQAALQN